MAAGTEVVCNDVVRKVENEEKCIAGLDTSDLNEVGDAATVDDNVGGNGNSNVGGNGKEDTDDSSYVFVNGSIEVTAADPAHNGDANVDAISPKSDWADEVDQFQKEKLGIENGEIPVDPLILETNGIANGSATIDDPDVKADKDEVNLENGSTVDPVVLLESNGISQDVNGHFGKNTGEEEQVVESTEVNDANEITNVEAKTDDSVSGITVDPESTVNPIESSQVTAFESEYTNESESQMTITQPDLVNTTDESLSTTNPVRNTDCEVMVNGGQESVSTLIDKSECQVTVDESSKPSEDLECQVTADESESFKSQPKELESQVTVDESSKPAEDLEFQVTADESEASKSQPQELESQVTVDEPGKPAEDLECEVTADESEASKSQPQELESQVTVDEPGKPAEDLECEVTADESEASKSQPQELESQVTVDEPGKPSEDLECEVTADESESSKSQPKELESQVTVDESSKPTEDLEFEETAEESESSKSQPQELEDQVTVDVPGKPFEDSECEVIADEPESGSPVNEEECQDSIDTSVDNQESPVSVDVPESNVDHTEKVDTDRKLEEHQDLSIVDSEVNVPEAEPNHVCNGIEAEHQSETKKDEVVVTESETEPKENSDSGLVLSEGADILTNGQVEKSDEILEMGETQIVADEDVPLTLDAEKTESEETFEKQVDESSETLIEVTEEPVELETNIQEIQEDVKLEDEIQESQIEVIENVQDDMNTAESTIEAEAPLETEASTESITHEDTVSENEVSSCVDETQAGFQPEEIAEIVTDSVELQCKNGELLDDKDKDLVSNPDELTVAETKVDVTETVSVIENGDTPNDDEEKEIKVEDTPFEDHSKSKIHESVIEFGSIGRLETFPNIPSNDDNIISVPAVINGDTSKPVSGTDTDNSEQNVDDKMTSPETEDIQRDEIPLEDSVIDAPDAQNEEEEEEILPYNFLIRIPRFEDDMIKDQIRNAQLQVEEKTRLRDAIRLEIQSKRARLRAQNEAYNAAKQEETGAKRLVRLKRQEIDSVQSVINRLKNAESVEEIDHRIYTMEHMIQHETLNLKDEKQLIREMKQLKTIRDQLASNLGSQDEIQQAMDKKDQTEERMKTLRKELDVLKGEVTKAEATTAVVGKKYDEISKKERELQVQFRAADDVRQKAYANLNSLKKQSYDKNKNFRLYKEDVMAARGFASRGDKDSLHRLCANQVEAFMEQWNNNDEFRNDYVNRCNMNATRRQKYYDGNSIPPDDVAPVLPPIETVNRNLVSIPIQSKPASIVPPVVTYSADSKPIENGTTTPKNQTLKTKDVTKSDMSNDEDEKMTKEEMEIARKAEEVMKKEVEAKQKELKRLEEKAKATEALERKKRVAEKAQLRAELRARKEAEQKEKEREKRMRKKEKKKVGEGSVNGEEAASSESSNEGQTKDDIINNNNSVMKKKVVKPPAHFFAKQLKPKPVPPPASIRNRKRWQQWVKLGMAAVAVLVLFLLGNTGFFLNLKVQKTINPNGNGNGGI